MVTNINDIIRVNLIKAGERFIGDRYILDFWRMTGHPNNMEVVGEEFQKLLEGKKHDVIAAVDDEGLVLATIIGRKTGIGMCNTFQKDFPYGNKIVPQGAVRNKDVLLTTGLLTDGYSCFESARSIIKYGGNPRTIATLMDYDDREEIPARERVLRYSQNGDAKMNIDVISLVKSSDIE